MDQHRKNTMSTPFSSRHGRTMSPPPSAASSTIGHQQKLNVVTRLAVEGKAKQGQDGGSIKMYLKISLPLESVIPGSTIPLFPEENIKILTSQVHPIDHNSVPYNFSTTTCPLLHNAARALNLPARSSQSYLSVFGLHVPSSSSVGSSRSSHSANGTNPPPLDDKLTGHILISGYYVSYVLPKEFPPRFKAGTADKEGEFSIRDTPSSFKGRRASIGEKNDIQFMAAIDMWVPYVSRPPRAPYLLSIPTPRCLSNNIRLRIFPPTTTSASFASLSSAEEEAGTWDLTSDPHVTRGASTRLSRANSYNNFADDESSDSSTTAGFSEGCGIQGTFPSADRIRVRWATPLRTVELPDGGDGRRRVGVKDAKGEMTCVVIGKGKNAITGAEGLIMNVDYKAICKGVWFAGVATLLGMDIGLEATGSDVVWAPGSDSKWSVSGGSGYTGFDAGGSDSKSRHTSADSGPPVLVLPPSPGIRQDSASLSRQNSTSSLLRAPLPAPSVSEYSFEGSAASSVPSGTISSLASLAPSGGKSRAVSIHGEDSTTRPPGVPITIHININDLLPPSKNMFTFNISGTILVTPRSRPYNLNSGRSSPTRSDSEPEPEPVALPQFSILAADSETRSIIVRNEVDYSTLEVYNSSGDIRDAQTRKTVLQRGGFTKCGADGGRIALRSFRTAISSRILREGTGENGRLSPGHSHSVSRVSSSSSVRQTYPMSLRPRRDGPLIIPSVKVTVTPLTGPAQAEPNAYGVRVCLPAPSDPDSEWLEFGLAKPSPGSSLASRDEDAKPPRVEIASASVDGVPVRFETTATVKQEHGLADLGVPFEEMSGKEWVSWVKVFIGGRGGGKLVVDYVVKIQNEPKRHAYGKGKAKADADLDIFLPTFSLPVGRLQVTIETGSDLKILSLRSNMTYQQYFTDSQRLLQHSLEELFYPRLTLTFHTQPHHNSPSDRTMLAKCLRFVMWMSPTLLAMILLFCLLSLGSEVRHMKHSLDACSLAAASGWDDVPETVTLTTTYIPSSQSKWWFGETPAPEVPAPTVSAPSSSSPTPSSLFLPDITSTRPPTTSVHTRTLAAEETTALLAINSFRFPWPLRFDVDLLPVARVTVNKVLDGLELFWNVFRKIYHYPLDPPP